MPIEIHEMVLKAVIKKYKGGCEEKDSESQGSNDNNKIPTSSEHAVEQVLDIINRKKER